MHKPNFSDVLLLLGILLISIGSGLYWNWPLAAMITGYILLFLAIWIIKENANNGVD